MEIVLVASLAARVEVGPPELSRKRVALWNRHRQARGLLTEHSRRDPVGYQEWLVETCAEPSTRSP